MQVKLVDAGFIWTEPHSRRLKTKLTVQSEVFNGAILQQTFVVEYVVETHMCPDCSRAAANPNTWTAVVQVNFQPAVPQATSVLQLISYFVHHTPQDHNVGADLWSTVSHLAQCCVFNVCSLHIVMHGVQQARHAWLPGVLVCGRDSPSARVCAKYELLMMQVRQHTEHKRTFMFLEQVILKYNAASTCINIKDIHEVGVCLACSANDNTQHGLPNRVQLASKLCVIVIAALS